jgi:hypothetical protein
LEQLRIQGAIPEVLDESSRAQEERRETGDDERDNVEHVPVLR